ncbi:MAG: hypothetical protein MHPSP_002567, partial [Paramarteilia canceri]
EQIQLDKGTRSSANFRKKCSSCNNDMVVDYEQGKREFYTEQVANSGENFMIFASFHARGCKINKIFPPLTLMVRQMDWDEPREIELEEGMYIDCDRNNNQCSIMDIELKIS